MSDKPQEKPSEPWKNMEEWGGDSWFPSDKEKKEKADKKAKDTLNQLHMNIWKGFEESLPKTKTIGGKRVYLKTRPKKG